MKMFLFIRNIFKKFPLLLINSVILIFIGALLDVASIFSLVVIIDLFLHPNLQAMSSVSTSIIAIMKSMGLLVSLKRLLVIFVVFNLLKAVFQVFIQYAILKTKYAVLNDIMVGTFRDFFNAQWYFFSSGRQGTLFNTFLREISMVGNAFGAMARYFAGILQILLCLAVPFYLSWKVTTICILAAVLFAAPFWLLGRVSYRLGKLNTSTSNDLGSVIQESLNLVKVILGFGNKKRSVEWLSRAFDAHQRVTVKSQTLQGAIQIMYYPFGLIVLIIGFFISQKLLLSLSETMVLLYSLIRVIPSIGQVATEKHCLDNFFPSYEQVTKLRDNAKHLKQRSGSRVFSDFSKEVSIERLSFAYPGHAETLTDINLRIPKGRMIAFVGESGAGKSTLIDMIMGFYEPKTGCIKFDGILLEEFDIESYRKRIGYVPQDSVLFNMSIRDNLLWAKEDATIADIEQACKQANAYEFIEKFSNKYETVVGDRGVRLSGGQVQRVALARAILRRPELLILDEATSALDTHSERLIQQAVENIAKETTVIVIAHRLSTIVNADYIYVLKDGKIMEEGAYSELVRIKGHFSRMVQLQELKA